MKRFGLIALSFIPIPLGLLTDHLMMKYNWFGFPLFLIGIVFYIFWFFMGYISAPFRIEHFIIPAFLLMLATFTLGFRIKAQQLMLQNCEV